MMKPVLHRLRWEQSRRNLLKAAAGLCLLFPIVKFIRFQPPRKPVEIEVNSPLRPPGFIVTRDFILFDQDGRCWALSRRCTHLGCTLQYREDKNILECPCHHSRFSAADGTVLQGPAKRTLTEFLVEKRESAPFYVVTV